MMDLAGTHHLTLFPMSDDLMFSLKRPKKIGSNFSVSPNYIDKAFSYFISNILKTIYSQLKLKYTKGVSCCLCDHAVTIGFTFI